MAESANRKQARGLALRESAKVLGAINHGFGSGITFNIYSNSYIEEEVRNLISQEIDRIARSLDRRAEEQFKRIYVDGS